MEEEQNQVPAEPANIVPGPAIVEHHHSASRVLLWIGILIITFATGAASAWAFLNYQDSLMPEVIINEPVNQEENLPVVEEEEEVVAEIDWKTYSDYEYSFGLNIPSDYSIETESDNPTSDNGVAFVVKDDFGRGIITIYPSGTKGVGISSESSRTPLTLNNIRAEKITYPTSNNQTNCYYRLLSGPDNWAIGETESFSYRNISVDCNESPIEQQILSSLVFYSDGNIPWNTYSNQTWGFSFQYPPDWTIATDNLPKQVVIATSPNQNLVIGDLTLFINPGGFGTGCADTNITFGRQGSGLEIINEESFIHDDPTNEICYRDPNEDLYDIHAHEQLSEASTIQDRKIYMRISTDDAVRGKNIMTGIISTFKFN